MKGDDVSSAKISLAEILRNRQSSDLPEISEEEQRACIRSLAQEAMVAVPAYLAELRNN